jgi:CRP-like cAMP-binding protein
VSSALSAALGRIWIFEGLAGEELARLAALARIRVYKARETIVEKGDPPRELFVLLSGRAKVLSRGAEGADAALNVMGPGQVFGEVAILDGQPRWTCRPSATFSQTLRRSRSSCSACSPAACAS